VVALGIVFSFAVVLVALYGANSLLLSLLYLRHRSPAAERAGVRRNVVGGEGMAHSQGTEAWPAVTVQLPIYNEMLVAKRLIDAVARMDYPHDRLEIQVLDDSTDETSRLIRARVAHHRARGLDIEMLHREDRQGFKAGALAHGLEAARGEYIVLFDADFVPSPTFLTRTIPHLVADPSLAFVQTRWAHLNPDYSVLTRAQTIALDGHFVVEHLGRNRSGLLMNFNGTAGVWRRTAIEDAGGWQSDTLTEDVDLSLRAQLAGWHALYLPDVESPAELPPQMAAFRRQQARWATGAAQCLRKLGGALLRGRLTPCPLPVGERESRPQPGRIPAAERRQLSWPARLEGLLHLSVWVAHPMSLVLLLLTPLMLLGQIPLTFNLSLFWLVALGPVVAYALSQQYLYPDWRRRMLYMPVLALLGTGLALSNTIAISQGLLGRGQPFRRTPKFRLEQQGDRWQGTRYALPFQWVTLGELALAAYALATIGVALSVGNYFSVPFLLLYAGGYAFMGVEGLRDAWPGWHTRPRSRRGAAMAESREEQAGAAGRGQNAPRLERRAKIG
jgi:cellulose synthase/poly-beta-1,6-N-acetylglucosamine synthase-like glycosyltransferase